MVGIVLGIATGESWSSFHRQQPPCLRAASLLASFIQALLVAFALGAIGGLYPAYKAAGLSPIEALRYE